MTEGQMKATVEAAIKRTDPKVNTSTFYDNASDRLFVTIVRGTRKVAVTLRRKDFANGDSERVDKAIADGFRRLEVVPIG